MDAERTTPHPTGVSGPKAAGLSPDDLMGNLGAVDAPGVTDDPMEGLKPEVALELGGVGSHNCVARATANSTHWSFRR